MGSKIRKLRMEQGLKISDLAEKTGLTSSTISQVERALISPSISTLKKICDALEISIGKLFEEASDAKNSPIMPFAIPSFLEKDLFFQAGIPANVTRPALVLHEEDRKIMLLGEGVRFYLLTPNLQGPFEFTYNEFDPGASTGETPYTHQGVECGIILSGELTVRIDDDTYPMKKGDSITFQSSRPHVKTNHGEEMCTCIWVNFPPSF
ncbi:MAG: cupin domain-containing protein [Clostridiales Family XIII bacterium]|nr:cupin domain-containing protein [Clostridiales Family XIII bacterium]